MGENTRKLKELLKKLKEKAKTKEQIRRLKFQITSEKIRGSKIVSGVRNTIEFAGQLKLANRKTNVNLKDVISRLPA